MAGPWEPIRVTSGLLEFPAVVKRFMTQGSRICRITLLDRSRLKKVKYTDIFLYRVGGIGRRG